MDCFASLAIAFIVIPNRCDEHNDEVATQRAPQAFAFAKNEQLRKWAAKHPCLCNYAEAFREDTMFSAPKNIYSFFFLSLLFGTVCLQSAYMIAFEGVFPYAFPMATLFSLALVAYLLRNTKQFLSFVGVTTLGSILFWGISLLYPDFSFDGPWYHQPIANSLVDGANVFKTSTHSYWGDAYPKAIEIFGGEMLRFFPTANGYMLMNLWLATGLFFYILYFSATMQLQKLYTYIFAFFAVFSYVFVQLAYAHYVDYALYVMMLYSMLSLVLILQGRTSKLDYAFFIMTNALAISIKMSGGLYPFVAFTLLFGYGWYYSKSLWATIKKCFLLGVPVAMLGVLLLGYNPYVTNMLNSKHILHPLMGESVVPIIDAQQPRNLDNKNRFEKLFISLTSETYNTISENSYTTYKYNPFSITVAEVIATMSTGTRIGGWGPLFLAVLLFTASLPCFFRVNTHVFYPMAFFLLLATFIHPESWWARYGFHVYVLPLCLIACLQGIRDKVKVFIAQGALGILVLLLLVNLSVFMYAKSATLLEHNAKYQTIFTNYKAGDIAICMSKYDYKLSFHPKQLFDFYGASMEKVDDARCRDSKELIQLWHFSHTPLQ